MTSNRAPALRQELKRQYLKFGAQAIGCTALLIGLGWKPTESFAGSEGVTAMWVGCIISLAASLAGALPLIRKADGESNTVALALKVTVLRLGMVALLAVGLALTGWFAVRPLMIWVALSYVVLLFLDSRFTLQALDSSN